MDYKKNIRSYRKDECITFRSTKEAYGALSNMAGGFPIKIQNTVIRTSEALYQALKFPRKERIQKKIIAMKSPIFAKRVSRKHQTQVRTDWESIKFKVMRLCIELKLIQNFEKFSYILLSTNDKAIVEYSDKDKIWGASYDGEKYVGINAQGRLLMAIRENLKKQQSEEYIINPPSIENLFLIGDDILEFVFNNYKTAR
ncbi:NADAR family protein [Fodinibius roseus]|nr:NADAR family protein [Fodinibius roseus]